MTVICDVLGSVTLTAVDPGPRTAPAPAPAPAPAMGSEFVDVRDVVVSVLALFPVAGGLDPGIFLVLASPADVGIEAAVEAELAEDRAPLLPRRSPLPCLTLCDATEFDRE